MTCPIHDGSVRDSVLQAVCSCGPHVAFDELLTALEVYKVFVVGNEIAELQLTPTEPGTEPNDGGNK